MVMKNSRIVGLGRYLPERVVTNNDLAKIMDTSDPGSVRDGVVGACDTAVARGTSAGGSGRLCRDANTHDNPITTTTVTTLTTLAMISLISALPLLVLNSPSHAGRCEPSDK
jgi:hypothetical protein